MGANGRQILEKENLQEMGRGVQNKWRWTCVCKTTKPWTPLQAKAQRIHFWPEFQDQHTFWKQKIPNKRSFGVFQCPCRKVPKTN